MNRRNRVILLTVLLAMVAVAGACSSNNKVGGGVNVDQLKNNKGSRLGEVTTTIAPVTTQPPVTKAPVTTAKPVTTIAVAPSLEIKIQSAAPQFNPSVGGVRFGTIVRWTNTDTQARSVEADNGAFTSGPIAPGGHFDLKAPARGTYNYHDGTRPYAVAQLQVS